MIHGISLLGRLNVLRGMWQYLTARVVARAELEKARIALAKERERNQAIAIYIERLPDWAELVDREDRAGRSIWIKKGGCSHGNPDLSLTPPMVVVEEIAPMPESFSGEGRPPDEITQ